MEGEKNINKAYMPSIEELQNWYEEELRIKALKQSNLYSASKIKQEESFYQTFSRVEYVDCSIPTNCQNENIYYKKYSDYIERETLDKGKKIEEIENRIEYEKFFLSWERKMSSENNSGYYNSNPATRYRVDLIQKLERQLKVMLEESLEAWEFYYKRQLIRDIENQREKQLVEVPYVVEAKNKIIESLRLGTPVYIIGHLGSGKTQLASEAALDFTIQNNIQREIENEMEEWYSLNKNSTENDAIEKFGEINKRKKIYYKNILAKGSKEEIESLQPLFISGSHNLTYEDMFVEKTLSLEQSFSQGSFIDYLNLIVEDFYQWLDEHKEKLEEMSDEEQLQLKIQIWQSFSDLLVESNSAFGTEIKKIEREILIAVKQGRPVIVDELNTIAMQNLIALNDILQQHAGNTAYITGVGPVLIHPGFGFIGTGNLSTEMVNYEGTNELNPAFKSRFMTIEYNYVPQNIVGSMEEQEFPERNELFRIILTRLADEDGNIQIPNSRKTLEELFRFSQLSKLTQNIFMGKWKENENGEDIIMGELELKESVLSIRNILHVLNIWNLGEEKDLSKALWDGFISSITYPDDKNYIISQAVRFGFFPESEGWSIELKGLGKSATTYDEIRSQPYNYKRSSMETLSYLDLVHLIFGKRKNSENLQKGFSEYLKYDAEDSQYIDVEKFQELDQIISHLEHTNSLMDYLEDNGGRRMKINLSVDREKFYKQVKELRKKLEESKKKGILNNDFEKQLDKLLPIEQEILTELIPYYRVYRENIINTELNIRPLIEEGAYSCNNFLQSVERINKNLFIINTMDNKTQLFSLNNLDDYNKMKVEWSPIIEEIKEKILCLYKIDKKTILLLGVKGGNYLILSEDFCKKLNINEDITIKAIKTDCIFNRAEKSLAMNDGLFVVGNEDEKLNIYEIIKEDNTFRLVFYNQSSCIIPQWTALEKISDDCFFVGTELGELYFIKYQNGKLKIIEKITCLSSKIRQVKCLENENGSKNSYMVIGDKGEVRILYLDGEFQIIENKFYKLKGNLFEAESIKGTATVLSEDGIMYLFEENFGKWSLNRKAIMEDAFFINIIKLDISKYLFMDLEGKLNILYIDRITKPRDLSNLKLY